MKSNTSEIFPKFDAVENFVEFTIERGWISDGAWGIRRATTRRGIAVAVIVIAVIIIIITC